MVEEGQNPKCQEVTWKTPKAKEKLEATITVKSVQEPVKALQVPNETLKEARRVRGVQPVAGGRVVLRFADKEQRPPLSLRKMTGNLHLMKINCTSQHSLSLMSGEAT